MNLLFAGVAVAIVAVLAHLTNNWVEIHALAVWNGGWSVQKEGWAALWPLLVVGIAAGSIGGFSLGLLLSKQLADAVNRKKDKTLQQREEEFHAKQLEFEKQKSNFNVRLDELLDERTRYLEKAANDEAIRAEHALMQASHYQQKLQQIQNKLKGAQQRANRMKKRAEKVI